MNKRDYNKINMIMMIKEDLYRIRFAIIPLIIYVVLTNIFFGTMCPFKIITGYPCPACGLTHATIHLITGNFSLAIQDNPTVFIWIPYIVLCFINRYIYKLKLKLFPAGLILVCILTLLWYIFKISTKF